MEIRPFVLCISCLVFYVTAFKFLSSTATVLEGRLVFWRMFRRAPLVKVPSISHITVAFPFNGSDITCTL